MKKLLLSLFLTLGLSTALALNLPEQAELVVVSEAGAIIGIGDLTDGILTLELIAGNNGFAKLLVVDAEGILQAAEVMVNADGSVTLILDTGFVSLGSLAADAGVAYAAELDAELSETAAAILEDLPVVVGLDVAAEARANAGADAEVEGAAPDTTGLDHATSGASDTGIENAKTGLGIADEATSGNTPPPFSG